MASTANLYTIGPTIRHADTLDWVTRLPLAGRRLVVPAARPGIASSLDAAGAEVVRVPLPVTPAARVVMGALPLTGCVVSDVGEVDRLDDERGEPVWIDEVVSWCLGRDTARRARERGWGEVRELPDPEFQGVDWLAIRPKIQTAPTIIRPGPVD